ncbi:hypothetical protein [Alkalicoccus daliensis]|uniref:hypothetical protein n=1 Tax=Alkalicoccus daliensis TaxID=745820 RepID=UPI000B8A37B9|nr:hypothetical protein [Alkalicoccus daliensis]
MLPKTVWTFTLESIGAADQMVVKFSSRFMCREMWGEWSNALSKKDVLRFSLRSFLCETIENENKAVQTPAEKGGVKIEGLSRTADGLVKQV